MTFAHAAALEATVWRCFSFVLAEPYLRSATEFFASGGNSVRAALLAAQLRAALGCAVTQEDVYRYPTPLAMSAFLRGDPGLADIAVGTCLTTLSSTGDSDVIVALPSRLDVGRLYWLESATARLAKRLHAVHAPRMAVGGAPGFDDIAAIGERAADEFLATGATEAHVIGFCLGSYVAWPLAQALRRKGCLVTQVVALDPPHPDVRNAVPIHELLGLPSAVPLADLPHLAKRLDRLAADFAGRTIDRLALRDALLGQAGEQAEEIAAAVRRRFSGLEKVPDADIVHPYLEWAAFVALSYDVKLNSEMPSRIVFGDAARERSAAETAESWRPHLDDLTVTMVSGHHYELLQSPEVFAMALGESR